MSQVFESVQKDRIAAVALGGNAPSSLGDPAATLVAALRRLSGLDESLRPVAVSRFYRTPAWPPGSGDDYVNAAALLRTRLPAQAVLDRLHATEAAFGRQRTERWGPRGIDLDLLFLDDAVLPDAAVFAQWRDLPAQRQRSEAPDRLVLPHPRLQDRAFVLIPLGEIAPRWRHPVSGRTVAEMAADLPEAAKTGIRPL